MEAHKMYLIQNVVCVQVVVQDSMAMCFIFVVLTQKLQYIFVKRQFVVEVLLAQSFNKEKYYAYIFVQVVDLQRLYMRFFFRIQWNFTNVLIQQQVYGLFGVSLFFYVENSLGQIKLRQNCQGVGIEIVDQFLPQKLVKGRICY
eukprot:TRINITY_DN3683_c0_g2_i1.p6 TRINITY_DN3683_c0_g2~~TRINITY_DN3683_c0_g2_i1.p6  ORF type:complete len:144 (-),score=0.42 TRINITY_DN3683_c0_g2_i1:221-652(-)